MKKILFLICMILFCAVGMVQAQTIYINTPDTVCVSTASSTAGQTKYLSVNAMVVTSNRYRVTDQASWSIAGPSGSDADYEVLYTGNTSATTKAAKLQRTKSLTLQFMQPGIYTLTITLPYTDNGAARTQTFTRRIVAMDCTINICGTNEANDKPGFFEDFGTMANGVNRRRYPIDGVVTYDYQGSGELADNYYAISHTTQLKPDWVNNTDHTGNNRGAMLVANSAYQPRRFYQKTVTGLCRGSVYNFSAWLINVNPLAVFEGTCGYGYQYAGVTFQVVNANNPSQVLANFPTYNVSMDLSNPRSSWQKYGGSFTVPSNVDAVIVQIINNKPGGCGNDIAIDDIEFAYCSPSITASILGKTDNLAEVVCEGAPITLTSSYTPSDYFVNPSYQWEMSDDEGLTYNNVPFGTNQSRDLVIPPGELKGTRTVPTSYRFRVRIYETGSDAVSCAAPSEFVRLTILPMPQLYLTRSQVCAGAFVELQASGGFDRFTWRDLPGYTGETRTIQVLGDTTIMVYGYVDYADGHTCVDSNTAFISSVDAPIVEVVSTSQNICAGSSVDIRINDAINNGTNIIEWFQGPDVNGNLTHLPGYDGMTTLSQVQVNSPEEGIFTVVVRTPGDVCRVQSAPFIINVTPVPVANAGPDQIACASVNRTGNFTMNAQLAAGETGTWTIADVWGPGAPADTVGIDLRDYAQILFPNLRNTRVTVRKGGTSVRLRWSVRSSANNACTDTASVVLTLMFDPSNSDAGPDTTKCGTDNVFRMRASAPDATLTGPYAEQGTWTLVSGNATIANIHDPNTTVTSLVNEQDIVLRWSITNAGGCTPVVDEVVLHKTTRPVIRLAPVADICNTVTSFALDTISTKGNPDVYSITTGTPAMPGFVAITNDTIRTWPMTIPIPANTPAGNYSFNMTYRNSAAAGCDSTVRFTVGVATPPTAPTSVTVGSPSICISGTTTLTVVGGTLGTRPDGTPNAAWVWYAGGCGIGTPVGTGASITVPVTATTTYYVRAESITGSCGNTTCASGTVTVYTAATTANAGPDQAQCNTPAFTLAANAPGTGMTGAWSVVSPVGYTLTAAQISNRAAVVNVTAGQTVTLRWTITNGACTSSDDVVLRNDVQPTAAAGPDQAQCNTPAFTLAANAPATGMTGAWSVVSPASYTLTAAQRANRAAVVNVTAGQTVTLRWTITNGTCTSTDDVVLRNDAPPTATAGANQTNCNTSAFTMTANTPGAGMTGTWTLPAGAPATIAAGQQNNPAATINVTAGNSVVATWTVVNGTCTASSTVTLRNDAAATTSNAGPDREQCNNSAFTLAANAPGTGMTGTWSVVSSTPAGFTFPAASINNRAAAITVPVGTTVTLRWTITNGTCSSFDDVILINRPLPTTAAAGADQAQCNNTAFTLAANTPTVGTGAWSVVSSTPGTFTLTAAQMSNPTANVTIPVGNTVTLRWTITNGACTSVDEVVLRNDAPPTTPNAGPDQSRCNTPTFVLAANAITTGTGAWSVVSSTPAGFTFPAASVNNPTATITVPAGTTVTLRWTATNGTCVLTDDVILSNSAPATPSNAGPDQTQCNNTAFTLAANAPGTGMTGAWSVVSSTPAGFTFPAGSINNRTAAITVPAGTTVTLRWTITNGQCSSTDDVVLTNDAAPAAANAGPDQARCNNSSFTMAANAATVGQGTWTLVPVVGTGATIPAASVNNRAAVITVPAGVTVDAVWTITNGTCSTSDIVRLRNDAPPTASAGANRAQCNIAAFTMAANTPGAGMTGTWTLPAGTTATIAAGQQNSPTATINVPVGTSVVATWTVVNGTCTATSTVTLRNDAPPTASAGADRAQCNISAFTMTANTPGAGMTGTWTLPAGTTATIAAGQQNNPAATINVPVGTSVVATWTVVNGTCTATSTVTLRNDAPPTATAGANRAQCNNPAFTMAANTPGTGMTGTWTLPAGTTATIAAGQQNNPAATINVPVGTSVVATWTVTNGTCTTTSTVTLRNDAPPTASAGANRAQCNIAAFTMTANTPGAGMTGTWTLPAGTTATIAAGQQNSPTATINVPVGTSVVATWTVVNGTCTAASTVTLRNDAPVTTAAAGPDREQCNNSAFTLAANAPTSGTGAWSVVSSMPAGFTFPAASISNPTAAITVPVGTTVTLRWTVTNGTCSSTDDVVLTNTPLPTTAAAGPDQAQCNNTAFTLAANTPTVGTGAWSVVSATPGTFTLTAAQTTNPTANVTIPVGTTVTLRWTITNGICTSADEVVLRNDAPPTTPNAGADQAQCNTPSFVLAANAITTGTGAWSVVSSTPAGFTFPAASVNNPTATITVPAGTTVTLRWTATNGTCSQSDEVTLVNHIAPTAAAAGPDQEDCNNTSTFTLAANAPSVATATGTWSVVSSAPAGFTFPAAQINNPTAGIMIPAGTSVTLRWTIANGTCSSTDDVIITNYQEPDVADAGPDQSKCAGTDFVTAANAPTVAGAVGSWTVVSGNATIRTGEVNNPIAHVTVPNGESAILRWTITNGTCSNYADVELTNFLTPAPANAGPDQEECNISTFYMTANTPDVPGATGTWTLTAGSTGSINAGDDNNPSALINVPAGDTVIAIWTITNGTCPSTDTVVLINHEMPTAAAAGDDQEHCNNATFTMAANTASVGTGRWTLTAGTTASFAVADSTNPNAVINVPAGVTVTATWTITNGVCVTSDEVVLINREMPAPSNAGRDQQQCNTPAFTMAANAPSVGTGRWNLLPGSTASFAVADSTNPTAVINVPAGETAQAVWIITNGVCETRDTVSLTNYVMPTAANAGADQAQCNTPAFTMAANTASVGTGKWSLITVTGTGASFAVADSTNPAAVINVPAGVVVNAVWTITNGVCVTTDTVRLTNYVMPTAAVAGSDLAQCNTEAFRMTANAASVGTGKWSLIPVTGTGASFAVADSTNRNAVITVPAGVIVDAVWTISNGVCVTTDTVRLTNFVAPAAANAGGDLTHCNNPSFTMAAQAPSVGTGRWSLIPVTGTGASFAVADSTNRNAVITVPAGVVVNAVWTISNGLCVTTDTVRLTNYEMPVNAAAGADQTHCDDPNFTMAGNTPSPANARGIWTIVSGAATIINPNDPNTTVRVASGQTVTLRWTITNGTCTSVPDDVVLTNQAAILGNTITADQLLCANETPGMLQGATLSGGNGTYTYQWQVSTTNATTGFANVTVGGTDATFTPPMITRNTWYRRVVMSGACTGNISNAVMLTLMNIPPVVISVPGPVTVDCVQGTDYTQRFGTPVFSHAPYDNEPLTITHNDVTVNVDACTTTIMRTWTATDRCGLTTQAQQTITVVDRTAPVFTGTAPANVTVECDQVPAAVTLTANDACNGTMTITPIEVRVDQPGACASNYQLIRKWVAVDACGNASDTLRQVITVRDMTPPVFSNPAPSNITVDCDKVPAGAPLTATDNCTPGNIIVNPVDIRRNLSGSRCADNYQIIRTWTATDLCGNRTVLTQTITVQDTIRPRFSMTVPPAITVDCDRVPSVEAITATDNCSSNVTVRLTERRDNLSSSCASSYRLTRTWTATDNCGNTNVMQQVITVQDTTRPVFVVAPPADTTVSCDAVPVPPTNLRATDNCSAVRISYTQSRETIQGACASNYRLIRVWTARDACNNTATFRQVITVTDTTRPVIDPAPTNVTLNCGDAIPVAATLYARDNCDATFPKKATMVQDPFTVDLCNGYTITRRWTISDACGNQAIERVQTITVNPCPKPALDPNMPANCSNNTKFAVLLLNKVTRPRFTLVSVVPANAVPTPLTQSSNVFDLNGATQATFTVTDGVTGCVSDPVTYDLQYVTKPVVELGNDVTICQGSTVTLDAGIDNAAYPIRWSTGATTQTIEVGTAGTYYATVTNGICATTDSVKVIVNMPPVVNIRDTAICQGESVTLNAYVDGGSYVWSTGATTASITVNATGTYSVDVTVNGCTTHAEVVVLVGTPPAVVVTNDLEICPNETAMLNVDPDGGSVLWNTGETTNSIVVSRPGNYDVTVTRDGCVVTENVTVTLRPDLDIDLGPDREFCNGGRVVVDATHPDAISYLWNDGDTNPVKEITGAGKYVVSVMDRFCSRITMDSVNVTVAGIPEFDLGRDTMLCIGEDLTLRVNAGAGNQIRWQDGSTSSTFRVTTPGTYTVTISNECGAMSDQIVVRYQPCEPKPHFPTGFTPNGDGHNDSFKPVVRGPMYDYDLRIYNRWGELIFLSKDQKQGWDGRYKGALVENGTYVWMLSYKKVLGGAVNVVKGEVTAIR
ncbi:gliding motility-associated C-terminal domain-containing protein [Chitinophaga rhizophila]|uniref:Gliding motility-associated C-terminal domain-containing protein n=1 Tax=Chitinophaga rhizophila TaxID=2866212 RepID=A0ABS7GGF3_9BACT|nr:gliding motility-associated C-terminal domain-containing protein [Chitinophaga rhizophila]MBW8686770.1 gliding motility-associated C-terminal domain-containing protein [Chitinophaga rhizophila]